MTLIFGILFLVWPAAPLLADFIATGSFLFEDRPFDMNGFTGDQPFEAVRYADVEVVDRNTGTIIGSGFTDQTGAFQVQVSLPIARTIYVRCLTDSSHHPELELHVKDTPAENAFYAVRGPDVPSHDPQTDLDFGTLAATVADGVGHAFNIYDCALKSLEYYHSLSGDYPGQWWDLTIFWDANAGETVSYYDDTFRRAIIADTAAYDDTVVLHETGHYIQSSFSLCQSPGGPHYITDMDQNRFLAFSEGWATFFGSAVRHHHGDIPEQIYVRTTGGAGAGNLDFSFELEAPSLPVYGSFNELAVAAAMWDLLDAVSTDGVHYRLDDDELSNLDEIVWGVMSTHLPASGNAVAESFYDGLASLWPGSQSLLAFVFSALGMEYRLDSWEPDNFHTEAGLLQPTEVLPSDTVVINEVSLGSTDWLELHNNGPVALDLDGWTVIAKREGSGTVAVLILPEYTLYPHHFVALIEGNGSPDPDTLYFPSENIPWTTIGGGSCALLDDAGIGVDFCRWGDSAEPPPAGTGWTGGAAALPEQSMTLGRDSASTDTDSASDLISLAPTLGHPNWDPLGGSTHHHTFYSGGDTDWIVMPATAGERYDIEALNRCSGAGVILTLLFPDGLTAITRLATDGSFGAGPRFSWMAPLDGDYLVRLENDRQLADYGSYDIQSTVIPPGTPVLNPGNPQPVGVDAALPVTLTGDGFIPGLTVSFDTPGIVSEQVKVIDRMTVVSLVRVSGGVSPGLHDCSVTGPDGITVTAVGGLEVVSARGAVRINEVNLEENWIELWNASGETADLTGWQVAVGAGAAETSLTLPGITLGADSYLVLYDAATPGSDTATELHFGVLFGWSTGLFGYCALSDAGSEGRDFIRWDGVTGGSSEIPPTGTFWYGTNPAALSNVPLLARDSQGFDMDQGSDFSAQISGSPGVPNTNVEAFRIPDQGPVACELNVAVDYQFNVEGGSSPYHWVLSSGYLPSGLYLTEDGLLSGSPAWGGSFPVELRVTEAGGREYSMTTTIEVDAGVRVSIDADVTAVSFPAEIGLTATLSNIADNPVAVLASLLARGLPPEGTTDYPLASQTIVLSPGQNKSYDLSYIVPNSSQFATGVEFHLSASDVTTGFSLYEDSSQVLNQ